MIEAKLLLELLMRLLTDPSGFDRGSKDLGLASAGKFDTCFFVRQSTGVRREGVLNDV